MTFTAEQIEWIVSEVLRRLGVAATSRVAGDERSSSPVAELKVSDRVVTMRTIEARLSGVKRVLVQRRAVVTPAVRDELKARKLELVFEN
jgi:archaellum component FlaD/FlaE